MSFRSIVAVLLLSVVLPQLAVAQLLPARFDRSDEGLVKRIEFPELRGDATARLRCSSQVDNNGKMKQTGCYLNTVGDEVYVAPIVKAARRARMIPALHNGKPIAVYVQFQVEFSKSGDERSIRVLNNPGLQENVDAYGEEHIAPQRGLAIDKFTSACPKRTRYLVWAKAHVAADGQHGSYSILPGEGAPITAKCREGILATLRESTYTPAMVDGEPVPSSFIEPFGN